MAGAKRAAKRAPSGAGKRASVSAREKDPIAEPVPRRQRSFYLPDELIARVRDAVAWTAPYPGEAKSMAELCERALLREVEALEKRRNNGERFPEVEGIRRGPAPGTAGKRGAALRESRRRRSEDE